MSDSILKIVPRDPLFHPAQEAETAVQQILRATIPNHERVEVKRHGNIVFVDCGENFESVTCPLCGRNQSMNDWQRWMEEIYRCGFRDREVVMPCCGATVDINDLHYESPIAFATWLIEIWNPDPAIFVSVENERLIEAALGTPIRQVLSRI
jgi:hypothetical protein